MPGPLAAQLAMWIGIVPFLREGVVDTYHRHDRPPVV